MSENKRWIRKEIMEIILYIFIGIVVCIIFPLVMGFSFRAFEETLVSGLINISDYLGQYLIYVFFIIGSLFLIIYPIASLIVIRRGEHPATQDKPRWYRIFTVSYIFNPEDGALWQLSEYLGLKGKKNLMKWSTNILRVFIIAILIFGVLGIVQVVNPKFNVVGVPQAQLKQQITATSDIAFGSGIPSFSENGVLFFVLFFLLGVDAYLCSRLIKDKETALVVFFMIALLVISPLMGLGWMSFHSIVYGNSEASMLATFIFGWLGSTMTILTGLFIFWFIWHFFNNLFIKLAELVTVKEDIIFIAIIVLGLIALFWIIIEVWLYLRKRKKRQEYPTI